MIYLDNAATTPPAPEVVEAMLPFLKDGWQNPSSGYQAGRRIRAAVDLAREQVATLIGAEPEEIIFTSGGTEANNMALFSAHQLLPKELTFLSSAIEHSAVLRPLERLAREGRKVSYTGVNKLGVLDAESSALDEAGFISLMWANNETGVIQPLQDVVNDAKLKKIPIHTDAVQVVGKMPLSVKDVSVDLLSLSGHKFNGPKGVGALYARSGLRLEPMLLGGGQEREWRSGTENVPAIVGMGKAAELATERLRYDPLQERVKAVRDLFEREVLSAVDGVAVNGDLHHRMPSISHLSFDLCEAEGLVILLDEYGVQCSAGSACMTGKQQPSHVQKAMGFSDKRAKSSLRFSFSHHQGENEAMRAVEAVSKAVKKLRSVQARGVGPVVVYSPE